MPAHMSMVFSNKTQNWSEQKKAARAQGVYVSPQKRQGGHAMNLQDIKNTPKGCKSCGGK